MKKELIYNQTEPERLDKFLAESLPEISRSSLAKSIKDDLVQINGQAAKPKTILKTSDHITLDLPEIENDTTPKADSEITLDLIYEDQDVIIVNKQPGLVVHPAAGHLGATLVNALLSYFPEIKEAVYDPENPVSLQRPGLVHRLDKDTSGAIMIARNARSLHSLSRQIQKRAVKKTYWALCAGWPKEADGRITSYLGRHPKDRKLITDVGEEKGKEAISIYKTLRFLKDEKGEKISLVEFNILTGRTHQIRVHAKDLGFPVLGDLAYGNKDSDQISKRLGVTRQMLHAKTLTFYLPGDDHASTFEAKLPEDFKSALEQLK